MKKIKYTAGILFCLILVGFNSCQNSLLNTDPYDSVGSDKMWTSLNLCQKGVNGIYQVLLYHSNTAPTTDGMGLGMNTYKLEALGVSGYSNGNDVALLSGSAQSSDNMFSQYWKYHYEGISRANDAIAHLPNAPIDDKDRSVLMCESKFMRAYYYYKLNVVYQGVPLYFEPITLDNCTKGRSSALEIWKAVESDLTDCIKDPNFPGRYPAGDSNYGHATKGAAYALRAKVYMWLAKADPAQKALYYQNAVADCEAVKSLGYALFQLQDPDNDPGYSYKQLFKEKNEQSPEMIFSIQCVGLPDFGNDMPLHYGSRVSFQQGWNSYFMSSDFADTYQNSDGSTFNWDAVIPGYSQMDPQKRSIYFARNHMTGADSANVLNYGADISKYDYNNNEARIKAAYAHRDPRLAATAITPYSTFLGAPSSVDHLYTFRWPVIPSDNKEPYDIRFDGSYIGYLFRKFVPEGASEIPSRTYSPIDFPLIRYADVVLTEAEALNELGRTTEAAAKVDEVRARVHMPGVTATTQNDMREAIRNERRWEFAGEGVDYFDELRWGTWRSLKFSKDGQPTGAKEVWGKTIYPFINPASDDVAYTWPIPKKECQMNLNLFQNKGWR